MKLAVALVCFCLAGCEGLQITKAAVAPANHTEEAASPEAATPTEGRTCPSITNTKDVLFWGMLLDGKDHSQGKSAYNWHGFSPAYKSLSFILTKKGKDELDYDMLMKTRDICCKKEMESNPTFNWAGMRQGHYEPPVFKNFGCMECEHLKQIIADVPEEYMKVTKGTNRFVKTDNSTKFAKTCGDIESVLLRPKSVSKTQKLFKALIKDYNKDMKTKVTHEEKIERLAQYLMDFAFLHPWGNGNGRFRTLQLNHEVRRLGLGCGAMMYNNNKDLYFLTRATYIAKIKEGIAMYDQAISTGQSPWVDPDVVAKHKEQFSPELVMPGLLDCKEANSKKGSIE
jgi:hypothetical protein